MAEPIKVAHEETAEEYVARIRDLVERNHVSTARKLVEEARQEFPNDPTLARWKELLGPAKVIGRRPASEVDRSAEIRWLDAHGPDYRGEWLAVLGDRLLGHSKSLEELVTELKQRPTEIPPILQYIPDID